MGLRDSVTSILRLVTGRGGCSLSRNKLLPGQQQQAHAGAAPLRTIQELGALDVAFLHLLTLVRRRLDVADGGGEDSGAALHQLFAEVDAVARGGAVQRRPGMESG